MLAQTTPALSRRLFAFTIIELLVVIAIIGVLMSILLPVLAQVRIASRNAVCKSNLRQMVTAFHAYAADNGGSMMLDGIAVTTPQAGKKWWFGFETAAAQGHPIASLDITQGFISPYLGGSIATGLQCPDFPYDDPHFRSAFSTYAADYGLNAFISPFSPTIPLPPYPRAKRYGYNASHVKNPATTIVFSDGITVSGVYPDPLAFQEPFWLDIEIRGSLPGPYGGFVHWRHKQTANAAYFDGHVDQVGQTDGYVVYTNLGGASAGTLTTGAVGLGTPYSYVP